MSSGSNGSVPDNDLLTGTEPLLPDDIGIEFAPDHANILLRATLSCQQVIATGSSSECALELSLPPLSFWPMNFWMSGRVEILRFIVKTCLRPTYCVAV